jgi:hypothetical protein
VHNLVTALQAELGLECDAAIVVATSYADAEVRAFVELERKLLESVPTSDPALLLYIEGLKALMRGNLDWSMESGRYTDSTMDLLEVAPSSGRVGVKSDIRELAPGTSSARRVAG